MVRHALFLGSQKPPLPVGENVLNLVSLGLHLLSESYQSYLEIHYLEESLTGVDVLRNYHQCMDLEVFGVTLLGLRWSLLCVTVGIT